MLKRTLATAAAITLMAAPAQAQILNFEHILDPGVSANSLPTNYYNGGPGGNFGITFSDNALVACLVTPTNGCGINGSRGGQGDPTSQEGALFFLDGDATFMTSSVGFTTGFSFFYSAVNNGGSFNVYDGADGTGNILASLTLPTTGNGSGNPDCNNTNFCPFTAAGVSFAGTAYSVGFAGVANQIAFDDVTFGSETPDTSAAPEPASLVLMGTGLFGIAAARRRLKKAA